MKRDIQTEKGEKVREKKRERESERERRENPSDKASSLEDRESGG